MIIGLFFFLWTATSLVKCNVDIFFSDTVQIWFGPQKEIPVLDSLSSPALDVDLDLPKILGQFINCIGTPTRHRTACCHEELEAGTFVPDVA